MDGKRIEVVVGTTEEYVLGYELCTREDGELFFEQRFADHSHTGSIRQVAIGGKHLVSGGTDEHIKVFDLNKHVEVGTLIEHEGTITYLGFHGNRYLFTGSEDGKICIFSKKGWKCEKTLRGHKGPVVSVSVHPSGKLALSLSQDRKLRTWNLIKGRKAYITHMDRIADIVKWSPKGLKYVIVKGSCLEVYDVTSCQVIFSIDFKERVTTFTFMTEDIIAVSVGDNNICLYDIANHFEVFRWEAHSLRVKSLCFIPRDDVELWLASASSDGSVKIWKLQLLSLTSKPELLAKVDTTCRNICMAVYVSSQNNKEKIDDIIKKEKLESSEIVEDSVKEGKKKRKAAEIEGSKPKKKKIKTDPPEDVEEESKKVEIGESNCVEKKEKILKKKSGKNKINKNLTNGGKVLKKKKKKAINEAKENVGKVPKKKKIKKKTKALTNLESGVNIKKENTSEATKDIESGENIKKIKSKVLKDAGSIDTVPKNKKGKGIGNKKNLKKKVELDS
ncbi:p21-activated protein kinase-interacting protein 1-like [Palaemon carinicauda]|uniref:p21-activated protein kinase-interacting protein 1-like n=1 Tax=Palaemon carinicauda TaxID=392227 RepID=UPI0035B5FF3A